MEIIHSDLKPVRATDRFYWLSLTFLSTKMNILIDRNFHPRLTDYGLIAILSDPNTVDPGSTKAPTVSTVRYMAPELLNPSGFGLKNKIPTKRSDIYGFGVVTYQVSTRCPCKTRQLKAVSGAHRTTAVPQGQERGDHIQGR